jgi:hypothetical protein
MFSTLKFSSDKRERRLPGGLGHCETLSHRLEEIILGSIVASFGRHKKFPDYLVIKEIQNRIIVSSHAQMTGGVKIATVCALDV